MVDKVARRFSETAKTNKDNHSHGNPLQKDDTGS